MSSHVSYASTPCMPSSLGLHLVASFSALQVEQQVVAQHAKRRGGPKKVHCQFRLLDARGQLLAEHQLVWKTITQKNFSNANNITQYQRNPFGSMHESSVSKQAAAGGSGAAVDHLLLVVHGALVNGRVSNTVGVNMSGKNVAQHPRFLLSSGKGAEGARSCFLLYHSDPSVRVQLSRCHAEHRELKITFENETQAEKLACSPLEFTNDFRVTYGGIKAEGGAEEDEDMGPKPPKAKAKPTKVPAPKAAPIPAAAISAAAAAATDAVSEPVPLSRSGSKLSALPPAQMPPALVERMRMRKRSFSDVQASQPPSDVKTEEPEAATDAALPTLGSPVLHRDPSVESLGLASTSGESQQSAKRPCLFPASGSGHSSPVLFASHFPGSGFDAESFADPELTVSQPPLTYDLEDGSETPHSQVSATDMEEDSTPLHLGNYTPAPLQDGAQDFSQADSQQSDVLADMQHVLDEAESAECRYSVSESEELFGLARAHSYMQPKQRAHEEQAPSLPLELALASKQAANMSVHFSPFGASPQMASPDHFLASPLLGAQMSPIFAPLSLVSDSGMQLPYLAPGSPLGLMEASTMQAMQYICSPPSQPTALTPTRAPPVSTGVC